MAAVSNILNDLNRIFLGGTDNSPEITENLHRQTRDAAIQKVALCALACFVAFYVIPSILPIVLVAGAVYVIANLPTNDTNYPRIMDYIFRREINNHPGRLYPRQDHVGHHGHRAGADCCPPPAYNNGVHYRPDGVGTRNHTSYAPSQNPPPQFPPQPVETAGAGGLHMRNDPVGTRSSRSSASTSWSDLMRRIPPFRGSSTEPQTNTPPGGVNSREDGVGGRGGASLPPAGVPPQAGAGPSTSGVHQRSDSVGDR